MIQSKVVICCTIRNLEILEFDKMFLMLSCNDKILKRFGILPCPHSADKICHD